MVMYFKNKSTKNTDEKGCRTSLQTKNSIMQTNTEYNGALNSIDKTAMKHAQCIEQFI